jgi:hypothetical protein
MPRTSKAHTSSSSAGRRAVDGTDDIRAVPAEAAGESRHGKRHRHKAGTYSDDRDGETHIHRASVGPVPRPPKSELHPVDLEIPQEIARTVHGCRVVDLLPHDANGVDARAGLPPGMTRGAQLCSGERETGCDFIVVETHMALGDANRVCCHRRGRDNPMRNIVLPLPQWLR